MSASTSVSVAAAAGIARITIDGPTRHNALDFPAMRELGRLIRNSMERYEVRCIVIEGGAGVFCAGADLPAGDLPGREENTAMMLAVRDVVTGIVRGPLPVVAAVDGPAAGVGASIAFACDVVVASRSAYFLLPFSGIGLVPDGGATVTVAAALGRVRAMRMALLQERLPAPEALEAGLLAEVCAAEDLSAAAQRIAGALAAGPRHALSRIKRVINDHSLTHLEAALDRETEEQLPLLDGVEFREGVAAFRERRRPDFRLDT